MPGVVRTRTGYAGGTTPDPTHKNMADHTETVEVDYNPALVTYQELLEVFFQSHNPNRKPYRQREYISLILYHDEKQKEAAERKKLEKERIAGEEVKTEISPYSGFTVAKERQQKWHIKRNKEAIKRLGQLYVTADQLLDSTLAARMNGLAKGYGSLEKVKSEVKNWQIEESRRAVFLEILSSLDNVE